MTQGEDVTQQAVESPSEGESLAQSGRGAGPGYGKWAVGGDGAEGTRRPKAEFAEARRGVEPGLAPRASGRKERLGASGLTLTLCDASARVCGRKGGRVGRGRDCVRICFGRKNERLRDEGGRGGGEGEGRHGGGKGEGWGAGNGEWREQKNCESNRDSLKAETSHLNNDVA